MKIFKEKPNIISEKAVWVCFSHEYMYISETLFGLLYIILSEWKHDTHLI